MFLNQTWSHSITPIQVNLQWRKNLNKIDDTLKIEKNNSTLSRKIVKLGYYKLGYSKHSVMVKIVYNCTTQWLTQKFLEGGGGCLTKKNYFFTFQANMN